jgi:hypothetical protein
MIYRLPDSGEPLDQGDIIQGCPLVVVESYDFARPDHIPVTGAPTRVVIPTQACDLANQKAKAVVVAPLLDAQALVGQGFSRQPMSKALFVAAAYSAGISSPGAQNSGFPSGRTESFMPAWSAGRPRAAALSGAPGQAHGRHVQLDRAARALRHGVIGRRALPLSNGGGSGCCLGVW